MKSTLSAFTLIFLFSIGSISAQDLTLAQVLSYNFPTNLTASDTEGVIAWVGNRQGVRNIYVARAPGYEAEQVTQYVEDDGQALGSLTFGPDHSSIIYVRGGAPNRRGEYPNPTSNPIGVKREIYAVDLATGFPRLLGEGYAPMLADTTILYLNSGAAWSMNLNGENAEKLFEVRGSVNSLRLSPDGSMLAFVNSRGDHDFIGIYDLVAGSLTFPDPTIDEDSDPVWSPDGNKVAFLRFPHETPQLFVPQRSALPFSIHVLEPGKTGSKKVWQADEGQGSAFRGVSARNQLLWTDQNKLVFPWEKDGWTHLYEVPAAGGAANLLTPGAFEVQFVSMTPDRKSILYSGNQDDINRQHVWRVTGSQKPEQITSGEGIEWSPVQDGSGTVTFLGSTGTVPAGVKRLDGNRMTLVKGTEDYPSSKLVEPQEVIFSAADGMRIHGQLFVPTNLKKDEKVPGVLFFHGGSRRQTLMGFHHRGYYHNAYALNQYLASRGFVVLSVNYRSGIGYGMEFREAINYGAGGASEFNDVLGAGLYLQNHANVDPDRIGLWGGSYGGYLTALGLARASGLFKAGVDIHGVTDWNAVIQNFVPSYNPLEVPEFAELAFESSPIASMETWQSPVLLIHGDDDRNVPFSETVDKAEALRRQGVDFEQLVFPDEVHGFLLHANWLRAYEATADFFKRKL